MPGRCPKCGAGMLKRKSKRGYAFYACETGQACGFMSWEVPTEFDCPECGQTMFKKGGKGRMKPFCINEKCVNFLPEDQRGYRKKKTGETAAEEPKEEIQKPEKKSVAPKTTKKAAKTTTKTTKSKKTTGGEAK